LVKKVVDTWKTKQWYQVMAPQLFDTKMIGEVIASEGNQLVNRVVQVGLDELTGDFTQTYTSVRFRIVEVKGKNAVTKLIGFEQNPSYVKTFIKRHRTLVDDVIDVTTADGQDVRVKVIIFAAGKIARDAEAAMRTQIRKDIIEKASKLNLDDFMREILFKKFASSLGPNLKKIAPLKRIEVRKLEIKENFAK